jgi:ATP-binding cassette, subfamily B, multidrug efflux pump
MDRTNSIRLIIPFFRNNRLVIGIGLVSLVMVDFLQLCIPRIVKTSIDGLAAQNIATTQLILYALYIVGIGALVAVFRYIWRRCLMGLAREIEEGLRNRLFTHIQSLSADYFDKTATGDLMAHATNDLQHIRMAAGMGIVAITDAIVLGSATIGFMLYINVKLTLFVLIPMPLIVLSTRIFSRRMHRQYQAVQGCFADLTEIVREQLAGIRIVKAYTREKDATARLTRISSDYVGHNLKLVRITQFFFPLMILFSNLSLGLVLFIGGRQTILGAITPGDFVAFISYIGLLTWPMMALGWVVNQLQRGKASLDRINAILKTNPTIAAIANPVTPARVKGAVSFNKVSFNYGQNEHTEPVLNKVEIDLQAGQALGIVGPPGSGKTTFLNLIPRLYDVNSGSICLDGIDLRKLPPDLLRAHIAFVPQEPFLFAGTIRTNITFDNPNISDAHLKRVIQDAALQKAVETWPRGLDTLTGERGVILSGGQKQRIALARALLKDAPLVILDDPVSQVDVATGEIIMQTIQKMAGKKTVIIVSHRTAAVRMANTIITLDAGRITESGSHRALIAAGGYYARTHRLQEIERKMVAETQGDAHAL